MSLFGVWPPAVKDVDSQPPQASRELTKMASNFAQLRHFPLSITQLEDANDREDPRRRGGWCRYKAKVESIRDIILAHTSLEITTYSTKPADSLKQTTTMKSIIALALAALAASGPVAQNQEETRAGMSRLRSRSLLPPLLTSKQSTPSSPATGPATFPQTPCTPR